jgi:radical SAM superfamily enzyme YgiQ (UPF0313 family)
MTRDKKVLLTTSYIRDKNDLFDWVGTNIKWKFRFSRPRAISYALRFIKLNIPSIEILEYPTWDEYTSKLDEGWDIVGYSFYLNDVQNIQKMVNHARDIGIKELWGGNYGVLTDGMEKIFDRIFHGYAEPEIAKALGKKISTIKHPPLINTLGFNNLTVYRFGTLFTSRGCSFKCSFCQTPTFNPKPGNLSLESIDEVLKYYKKIGIKIIAIYDENFGLNPKHADAVVDLLNKYKFFWACMSRADFVAKKVDKWVGNGGRFIAAGVGIESINKISLGSANKKVDSEKLINSLKKIKSRGVGVLGYYIIGFENETLPVIKSDLKQLIKLNNEVTQLTILTPLPKTNLWDELEDKYGIFEKDYTKFDTKHLVWNHPNISKDDMERTLDWGLGLVNPRRKALEMVYKYLNIVYKKDGLGAVGGLMKSIYQSNRTNNINLNF